MPRALADAAGDPRSRVTNSSSGVAITAFGVELADAVADLWPAQARVRRPGEQVPAQLEGVLGVWWSEGFEYLFRYGDGRLEGVVRDATAAEALTHFARDGEDLYRAVDGLERGELLRIVRDSNGAISRLEVAGYPFERRPQSTANPS